MNWRTFFWVWLAWSSIGLMHAMSRYSDIIKYQLKVPFGWVEVIAFIGNYSLWIIITLLLIHVLRRLSYPFLIARLSLVFFSAMVIWLPCYLMLDYSIATLFSDKKLADVIPRLIDTSGTVVFFYAVIYALTFAVCLGIVLAEKTRQSNNLNAALLQEKTATALLLAEQKMQLMQNQLSPHVLFNCLGSISALARHGEREALIDAVAKVGNLLRFTIINAAEKLITLNEELAFVSDYIALQSLRFEDRFKYEFKLAEIDGDIMCPPFALQPLVENAFRHGVEVTEEKVMISITVNQTEESIKFVVKNSLPPETHVSSSTGTGLRNLRTRLNHLYRDNYSLTLDTNKLVFIAELSLPTVRSADEL